MVIDPIYRKQNVYFSGTEKQAVAFDYAERVANGVSQCEVIFYEMKGISIFQLNVTAQLGECSFRPQHRNWQSLTTVVCMVQGVGIGMANVVVQATACNSGFGAELEGPQPEQH